MLNIFDIFKLWPFSCYTMPRRTQRQKRAGDLIKTFFRFAKFNIHSLPTETLSQLISTEVFKFDLVESVL